MGDQHHRSSVEAVSWRATGAIEALLSSSLVTGKVELAVSTGASEDFTKILLVCLHERIWNGLPFGCVKGKEDYSF